MSKKKYKSVWNKIRKKKNITNSTTKQYHKPKKIPGVFDTKYTEYKSNRVENYQLNNILKTRSYLQAKIDDFRTQDSNYLLRSDPQKISDCIE